MATRNNNFSATRPMGDGSGKEESTRDDLAALEKDYEEYETTSEGAAGDEDGAPPAEY